MTNEEAGLSIRSTKKIVIQINMDERYSRYLLGLTQNYTSNNTDGSEDPEHSAMRRTIFTHLAQELTKNGVTDI